MTSEIFRQNSAEAFVQMDDPDPGFREGKFDPDNWNDPVLNFIRAGLDEDKMDGVMRNGFPINGVVIERLGAEELDEVGSFEGNFNASRVKTALGNGVIIACPWCEDEKYALVNPERKGRWFYVSWYKHEGKTDKLHYAEEVSDGVFQEGEPVMYEDAIWLGHFVNTIQERVDVPDVKLERIIEKAEKFAG